MYPFIIVLVLTFVNPNGVEHQTVSQVVSFQKPNDCRYTAELLANQLRAPNVAVKATCQQAVSL